jgi:hypothetical protein
LCLMAQHVEFSSQLIVTGSWSECLTITNCCSFVLGKGNGNVNGWPVSFANDHRFSMHSILFVSCPLVIYWQVYVASSE